MPDLCANPETAPVDESCPPKQLGCRYSRSVAINTRSMKFLTIAAVFAGALSISGCAGVTANSKTPAQSSSSQTTTTSSALKISTTSLNFGSVPVGGSMLKAVFLTDTGTSNTDVSNIIISGAGYSTNGLQAGQILTPGETAELDVTLKPAAAGSVPGSVTLDGTGSSTLAVITLAGSGVQTTSSSHSVSLKWSPSASTVIGYNSYRSTSSGGPFTKLNSTPLSTEQYVDSTVQNSQTYFYVTTSVNSANVESVHSNEVSVTIPAS